jgi:hypothetical protein
MTTKHRILSVLTVLALVASLGVVMAAPAGATPGGGAVVIPTPTGAGVPASYNITFFAPAAIPVGGAILVTFPVGTTVPPGMSAANVTIGATAAANLTVIGQTVSLITAPGTGNITLGAGVTVHFTLAAGIINPGPGIYTLTVAGITSAPYRILGLARTPVTGPPGTVVTVTGLATEAIVAPGTLSANITGVIDPVTFMTTAAGAIPATTVTILPGATIGLVTFTAGVAGRTYNTTFNVTEAPPLAIVLDPTSGLRGTNVTVNGTGFPPGAAGIITAPGVISAVTFTTTGIGAIPATNVTILPVAPFGMATITATVGVISATAHFVVTPPPAPAITLSPTAGARNMTVAVTGTGFPPGPGGVIVAPGVIAPISTGPVAPNMTFSTNIAIRGDAPFGVATITATVGVVSDDATFTVRFPEIHKISPVGGVPGANVTIGARGFWPGTWVTITSPGVISPHRILAVAAGAFEYTTTILIGAPSGPATITATSDDPDGIGPLLPVTATAIYTVGIPASITLTPAIGFPGTNVTVAGFGFPHGKPITITAPPGVLVPPPPPVVKTTAAGTIPPAVTRIIAAGAPVGEQTITVTVGAVTATAVFTVAGPGVPIIPPPVPVVPVLKGLEHVWGNLGRAVLYFDGVRWRQFPIDPAIRALIPAEVLLPELEFGKAYWIYAEKDIIGVEIGGVVRTIRAGTWANIAWVR